MTALFNHQYATMWTMLHPQVQAVWPGKAAYITYWQTRFQNYTLQRFVLGKARRLQQWVNPETMIAYKQVIELPISLLLEPGQAIQQEPLAPPEDLHPGQVFQNLPFIVQQVAAPDKTKKSQWLILEGGPADLEAPSPMDLQAPDPMDLETPGPMDLGPPDPMDLEAGDPTCLEN